MRTPTRFALLAALAALVAACGGGGGAAQSPTQAAETPTSAATTTAAQSPSPDACAAESLETKTPGTLTVGADNPAFPPYFQPREGGNTEPWASDGGDPTTGEGFESAVAYAIAEQLGFAEDEVEWIPVPFNDAIRPGEKDFDIYLTQVSYSEERAEAVDLSEGYFDVNQAVIGIAGTPIDEATSVADLKEFTLGAPVGTTSLTYIQEVIQPTPEPEVYDTLDAAIQDLNGGDIDGVVVDLPTAFFATAVQLENGTIVGSLPQAGQEVEHFSVVLDKDSPLTDCVNEAIAAIKEDGTLDAITDEWITGQGAPELTE